MNKSSRTVGFVVYDEANLLDIAGPLQVFASASRLMRIQGLHPTAYRTALLSAHGGPITTSSGVALQTECLPAGGGKLDTVIVAGGLGALNCMNDAELISWLRLGAPVWRRTASVCTGSLLLAAAGLLDGRRAATHWQYCAQLQRDWPLVNVEREAIFVNDGAFWTSAGVSAGMDMALAMVEADWGARLALQVAKQLVLYLKRPGDQSQFAMPSQVPIRPGPITPLLVWIAANLAADCSVEGLAVRAGMSKRTLERAFVDAVGCGPDEYVEQVRVEFARHLLEDSDLDISTIAARAGFPSDEQMRRTLLRVLKVSPLEYRARFCSTTGCGLDRTTFETTAARQTAPAY